MAEKGRGKKVRFQGGGVFPIAILAVLLLGLVLIWYSRASIDSKAPGPRASKGDHWHISYGFYACDLTTGKNAYLPNLTGNIETTSKYLATGVHSHDDGVIHWHPTSAKASGRNAKLQVFLDNYGIKLSNDKLTFPADQESGAVYEEGVTKCKNADGKEVDGVLKAFVWQDSTNVSSFRVLSANLNQIRITENGMAITIAFVPEDVTSIDAPPSAAKLPELGAADSGGATSTTVATDGSATTVTGDTTVSTAPGDTSAVGTATTEAGVSSTTVASTATTVAGTATTG